MFTYISLVFGNVAFKRYDLGQTFWVSFLKLLTTVCWKFAGIQLCVWRINTTVYEHPNIIPVGKYGRGSLMIWVCFDASGPESLGIIEGKINSQVYQNMPQDNVRVASCHLKLSRSWVMQQDNDCKYGNKSTTEKKNQPFGVAQSEPRP